MLVLHNTGVYPRVGDVGRLDDVDVRVTHGPCSLDENKKVKKNKILLHWSGLAFIRVVDVLSRGVWNHLMELTKQEWSTRQAKDTLINSFVWSKLLENGVSDLFTLFYSSVLHLSFNSGPASADLGWKIRAMSFNTYSNIKNKRVFFSAFRKSHKEQQNSVCPHGSAHNGPSPLPPIVTSRFFKRTWLRGWVTKAFVV